MAAFDKKYVTYRNVREINFQEFLDISFRKTWGICGHKKMMKHI
jgi:hypothetical protein